MFNGSASVRNAAGTLIENTVKGVRRGAVGGDACWDSLFSDVRSLYRLDSLSGVTLGDEEDVNAPLPAMSKGFLTIMVLVWLVILGIYARILIKRKK